jgi:hypothetical protein
MVGFWGRYGKCGNNAIANGIVAMPVYSYWILDNIGPYMAIFND